MQGSGIDSPEVMHLKRYGAPMGWALGMLVLILDGKTAMAGAAEGLQLCIQTLIPNLFPFFLLSSMLTSSLSGGALLLTGILGGYPVGAGNVAQAYRAGQLSKAEAERMAVLCNCAGPSFIFGVIVPILGELWYGFIIWICYLFSILILWIILPKSKAVTGFSRPVKLQQALWSSIRAMAGVCGWVILFRVLLSILDRWVLWLLPQWASVVLYGILELSNGCLALAGLDPPLAVILAAGFVAFGGICVMLQTASVTEGLSMKHYFPGKVFQSAVSMLAATFFFPGAVSVLFQVVLAVLAASFLKFEKRCGNRQQIIV